MSRRDRILGLVRSGAVRPEVLGRLLLPLGRHRGISALGSRGALALAWAALDEASTDYESLRLGGAPADWPQPEGWTGRLVAWVDPRDMAWEVLESMGPDGLPHRYRDLDFLAAAVRFRRAQDAARDPEAALMYSSARELAKFCGLVVEGRAGSGFDYAARSVVDACGLASALRPGGCADALRAAVRRAGPYLD